MATTLFQQAPTHDVMNGLHRLEAAITRNANILERIQLKSANNTEDFSPGAQAFNTNP